LDWGDPNAGSETLGNGEIKSTEKNLLFLEIAFIIIIKYFRHEINLDREDLSTVSRVNRVTATCPGH
jgi:hypothetical protein